MTWNWQRPDWPNFRWQRTRLEAAEKQFLVSGGVFVGSVRHLVKEERNQLTIEAMSTEAVTTSEIEGEILDRASVQSSLRKRSEEHTSELQSRENLVCRLLLEKKNMNTDPTTHTPLISI